MNPWIVLDKTDIPASGGILSLLQRGEEFAIRINGVPGDLMNSRVFGSEQALAELACVRLRTVSGARVLVGGLGMGFTLAAALKTVAASARVIVAELIPAVVRWNQGALGECAGHPLRDTRTDIHIGDVADLVKQDRAFDAILLDVDNGPEAMTHAGNEWLYSIPGLRSMHKILRAQGILAIWSARANPRFTSRLRKAGFRVDVRRVTARAGKGSRHTIFLAQKTSHRTSIQR